LPLVLLDVSVTDPPGQNVVGPPAVIAGFAGPLFTVTIAGADVALQPLGSYSVRVYVPDTSTVIERFGVPNVVVPSDQK
jgi:hypothetical protein